MQRVFMIITMKATHGVCSEFYGNNKAWCVQWGFMDN